MSDLDTLKAMLDKTSTGYEATTDPLNVDTGERLAHFRLRVLPGYRAHFEAEFDAAGNLLNIGQWEDL